MTLNQLLGATRAVLMCFAGLAIGHGIAAGTWDALGGFIVATVTLGWGVTNHDADLDQFLSVVRGAIAAAGGFAVQRGYASNEDVTMWTGVALGFVPAVWSWFVHADPSAVSAAAKTIKSLLLFAAFIGFGWSTMNMERGISRVLSSMAADMVTNARLACAIVRAANYRDAGMCSDITVATVEFESNK